MDQGMPGTLLLAALVAVLAVGVVAGLVVGRAHRRLRGSEQRLRELFDHAADGIFVADTNGRYTEVNEAGCRLLGLQRDEIVGRSIADMIPPQDLPRLAQAREWLLAGHTQVAEWTLRCKNGDWLPVEVSTRILPGGRWQAFVRDMRERHQAQAQLQLAAAVFNGTQEGIIVTDARRRILAVNPAFSAISGYAPDELLGRDPSLQQSGRHDKAFYDGLWDALRRTDQWRGEIWNRRKNGEIYPAWENISRIRDASGEVTHYVAIQSDITPIKDAEARLRHLAHHDLLTGLPNRLLFANALQLSIARAARQRQRLALLFIDLDRFKYVNDSLGHAAGDQLLIEIGQRLKATVRAEDAVARLGGDEFTVVVEEAGSADSVAALARKIIEALSAPVTLAGREIAVSASVGIALFPEDADNVDNLCKAADSAMYRAKEHGRGVCDFYTPDITERVHEHLMLDSALHQALQRQELRLLFQPQYDAGGRVLAGVEALLRWQHPQAGLIEPERFIPVAEHSALINELGTWVIDQACAQLRAWLDQGLAPVRVAVNVSGRQVLHDHLVEAVGAALRRHRLQAHGRFIELELTEGVLQAVEPSAEVLNRLRGLGVRIAIDDFGTGYSSLSVIKHLPIDTLKIDRLFVRNLPDDGNSRAIVAAVVSMSHALGLRVVAEGVETTAQKDFLAAAGCDELQGFLLGRPDTAEATAALLAARDGAPAAAGRLSP
ncbi:MAG: EAL domain-containing protein [Burkholderiaceae bacterium]